MMLKNAQSAISGVCEVIALDETIRPVKKTKKKKPRKVQPRYHSMSFYFTSVMHTK